jgi:hypothetical protein
MRWRALFRRLEAASVLCAVLVSSAVRATECPLPPGAAPQLASADAEARLKFIQKGMRHAARKARIWAWSGAAVLVAVGSFQLTGAIKVPDRGSRIDLWAGAASILFSLAQMAAVPPLVTIDQWTVDRHVRQAGPDGDRCLLLAEAERLLVRDARSEEQATGLGMQAATLIFNFGTGMVLGMAYHRWDSAASNIVIGTALGELQILTQPTESVTLLQRYRAGDLSATKKSERAPLRWALVPSLGRDRVGLSLGLAF